MKLERSLRQAWIHSALLMGLAGQVFGAAFTNGSFENPALSPGTFMFVGAPSIFVTGWLHDVDAQDGLASAGALGVPAAGAGQQWFFFGGGGASGGTLEQTFDTVAGTSYTVAFLLMVQQGTQPESMKAEVFNGVTLLSVLNEVNFTTALNSWDLHPSFTFTATSTSSTLRFT